MTHVDDKRHAQIADLRAENEQLRRSAQAFGELSERLNRALLAALDSRLPTADAVSASAQRAPPAPPGSRTNAATAASSVTIAASR
jgi:hypothetical protein